MTDGWQREDEEDMVVMVQWLEVSSKTRVPPRRSQVDSNAWTLGGLNLKRTSVSANVTAIK